MTIRLVEGDAFGAALMSELNQGNAFEVNERDDGYVGAHPIARYFATVESWPSLEAAALDSCRGLVLDLGAGAGRATLELQKRGITVLAADTSLLAIEVCRRRGVQHTAHGSVFDLPVLPTPFQTVLMLGGNLGLLQSPTGGRSFLAALERHTAPGTQLLGIGIDPYRTDDQAHRLYYARNREAGRPGGQLRLRIRHNNLSTPWFEYWLASIPELEELVTPTIWELTSVRWGDENGRYLATLTRR